MTTDPIDLNTQVAQMSAPMEEVSQTPDDLLVGESANEFSAKQRKDLFLLQMCNFLEGGVLPEASSAFLFGGSAAVLC